MRLLHTSDWHLGRCLHRAGLLDAQSAFLDHLVATVRSERIDAVLIAGDVYDRAVPSADALALCEDGLIRLRDAGARVVAISGNHDSARRLGFGSRLLDAAGVHLRTRVAGLADPLLLDDAHGTVAIYGVPYLEPGAVRSELPVCDGGRTPGGQPPRGGASGGEVPGADQERGGGREPGGGHAAVLRRAAACIRADIAARGVTRSVVLAHAWVAGGFSYVALGHLHGQQTIEDHLRYSGSPLAYSFSEASHRKGTWLVELGAAGLAWARHVPAPTARRLAVLRGRLGELLTSPAFGGHEQDFVSVTLTDEARPEGAMDRLRSRFPHILVLSFEPSGAAGAPQSYRARVAGRSDLAVAAGFVKHVRGTPATGHERALLRAAFEAVRCGEDECRAVTVAG
jgi:exonuclease SbcD